MLLCSKCGHEVREGSFFCDNCGARLDIDLSHDPIYSATPDPIYTSTPDPACDSYQAPQDNAPIDAEATPIYDASAANHLDSQPVAESTPVPPVQTPLANDPVNPPPRREFFLPEELYPKVTLGNWLLTFLLLFLIPLAVGIIFALINTRVYNDILVTLGTWAPVIAMLVMVLIYAFSGRVNPSKRNFFRAYLIFFLIMVVIVVILMVVFSAYIMSSLGDINYLIEMINNSSYYSF